MGGEAISNLKQPNKFSIIYLYSDNHHNHKKYGLGVGGVPLAIDHRFKWVHKKGLIRRIVGMIISIFSIPSDYDIYLIESYYPFAVLARKLGLLNRKAMLINIAADPSYYNIYFKRTDFRLRKILVYLMRGVDGYLSGSKMIDQFIEGIVGKVPIGVFPNFVEHDKCELLNDNQPDLKSRNILFIGKGDDYFYKGLDVLTKSFKLVQAQMPDTKLIVIGNWSHSIQKKIGGKNIEFTGFIDFNKTGKSYFRNAALYLHFGRGDTFAVVVTEAMIAGLPSMVSEWTGSKDVVEKINPDFVLPLDEKRIAKKILEYFHYPLEKKETLSQQFRMMGNEYSEGKRSAAFQTSLMDLIRKIEQIR